MAGGAVCAMGVNIVHNKPVNDFTYLCVQHSEDLKPLSGAVAWRGEIKVLFLLTSSDNQRLNI